jgi:hypothetical protein
MIYTVTWTTRALQMLADIWNRSKQRNALTAASYQIDNILRDDPDLVGRHRYDTVREFYFAPLGVEFEVIEPDRQVVVLSVWQIPSP